MWNDFPEQSKSLYVERAYELVEWLRTIKYELKAVVGYGGSVFVEARTDRTITEYPPGGWIDLGIRDGVQVITEFIRKTRPGYCGETHNIVNFRYQTQRSRWNTNRPLIEFATAQVPRIITDIQRIRKEAEQSEEVRQAKIQYGIEEKQRIFQKLIENFIHVFNNFNMFSTEEIKEAWDTALVESVHNG